MTHRLYYESDITEDKAQVLSCQLKGEGHYVVELDNTLFHPQGGGQPSDKGTLNDIIVFHVAQKEERVFHMTKEPVPFGLVTMKIDKELRHCHSRWHSAGHLIGWLVQKYNWQPIKAHHWPDEARIVF